MAIRIISTVLTGLAVAACAPADTDPPSATRDSLGIEIIDNFAGVRPTWALSTPPRVALGAFEGDDAEEFGDIVGAVRLSDGTIVIGDGVSKEVRFFDADGTHRLTVGGTGQGPGEFRFLLGLDRLRADTLVAQGWPVGTWAWYTPGGDHIVDTRIGPFYPGPLGRPLKDGTLLTGYWELGGYGNTVERWAVQEDADQYIRPEGAMVRVSRDGETIDTLRTMRGEEHFKRGAWQVNLVANRLPYSRSTLAAWDDSRLYVGDNAKREVQVLEYDGTLRRIIRWEAPDRPVTSSHRAAFQDSLLDHLRQPGRRADYERWFAEVPWPETKPAFDMLLTDSRGNLWVRTADESDVAEWRVFDARGVHAAVAVTPVGLRPFDIGDDWVLGITRDEFDVEYVRLYDIHR